jgi:hypothetical protein
MRRRRWVTLNYLSVVLILAWYYLLPDTIRSGPVMIAVALLLLGMAVSSFLVVHMRTGLWRIVHSRVDDLDERQVQVAHVALRRSYTAFTIICLALLVAQGIAGHWGFVLFDVVLPAALIYVAHSLPSSILAWTEREV